MSKRTPRREQPRRRKAPVDTTPRRTAWSYGWHHRPTPLAASTDADRARVAAGGYSLDLAWDGHRLCACRVDDDVRLFADDQREWTQPFAPLTHSLLRLPASDFVLDGFVCVLDGEGKPRFDLLRAWVSKKKEGRLVFAAWDLLLLDGVELGGHPVEERRRALRELLRAADGALVCSEPLEGRLDDVLAAMRASGLPGVYARPASSPLPSAEPWVAIGADVAALRIARPLSEAPVVTRPEKVLYPRDGLTKQHVVDYYARIAPALLPHMRARPIVCQRWPDGIDDFTWYQHRVPPRAPDYVQATLIEGNRRVLINNPEALGWMANQAALTFHGWASRVGSLDQPDWVSLDLDPGESTRWDQLIDVAVAIRKLLELLAVPSVVKTSGQKGLHVLVPIAPRQTVEQAHLFAALAASVIAQLMPEVVSLEMDHELRRGRLLLDHLQRFVGKSLVLPYSLRAVDGAPVSTPLDWSEVTPQLDPKAFTLKTLPARLDAKGDLFAPVLSGTTVLAPLITKLQGR